MKARWIPEGIAFFVIVTGRVMLISTMIILDCIREMFLGKVIE